MGLVSLAAMIVPAEAADMNGRGPGGAKDYGHGAVPVPAPVPYEEHYKWYVSGGVGWTARSSGTVTGTSEIDTLGFSGENGPAVISAAFGRYITPSLRLEFGMDFRTKQKVTRGGFFYSTGTIVDASTGNYNTYDILHAEEARVQTNTYMLNGYYDFARHGGRLKPYVGAGIGVATHRLSRTTQEVGVCSSGNHATNTNGCHDAYSSFHATLPNPFVGAATASDTGIGLAASVMAGIGIDLSARTHLDIGYRFMWQGGTAHVVLPSTLGTSKLEVGDRKDHEIRTTLRFDLW
jgi:hypothetical protein